MSASDAHCISSFLQRYDVKFSFTRTTLKLMHQAVELASSFHTWIQQGLAARHSLAQAEKAQVPQGEEALLGDWIQIEGVDEASKAVEVVGTTGEVGQLNGRQQEMLQTVLSRPRLPVVLWGPPGTGKTMTLVNCVLQVPGASCGCCSVVLSFPALPCRQYPSHHCSSSSVSL